MKKLFSYLSRSTAAAPYLSYWKQKYFPSGSLQELQQLRQKRASFYSLFLSEGDLCFDIGANLGNRTEVFLSLGARVVAVEPQPHCSRFLTFRFGNRISIERAGLDEKPGEKTLLISDQHMVSSFSSEWIDLMKKERFPDTRWQKKRLVRMTTLDALIARYGKPAFCKIDVEGFEYQVLKGLTQTFQTLSFEYCIEQNRELLLCLQYLFSLSPGMVCNFSVAESMELALDQWLEYEEARQFFQSADFLKTGGGDVYVKHSLL
ncbi:MAG: FkbM family methyltransferase [Bacteroidetes bacterium]|nr:FkbM family methyltransferase [Bacteroidota bacterium]